MKRPGIVGLLVAFLLHALEAAAAGGAHIVDDSEVETPGTCHLETWVTRFVPGEGYFNLSPVCTAERLPRLEFGAAFQHYWDQTTQAPLLGPAVKLNFQPESTGVGVGLGFNAGVSLSTGDLGFSQLVMLVTLPLDEKVRFNLNAGWSYLKSDHPDALFYGAQVEAKVGWDLTLMLEVFGRAPNGVAGTQLGLRYTPKDGPIDFDFLAGSFFDTSSSRFFTVGVTVRY
ncbi:hypothetical protein [Reyranella sp.]|uniref:hypothetical protein n=1 Tax=Reyranella sp. TaxID=1929291 RepID=UPI003BAC83CE